jgi:ATP-dependent Clp protease, protease subunit
MSKEKDLYNEEHYSKILNKNRYILLYNEICDEVAEVVVEKLYGMDLENHKEPITLEISSGGGYVSAGFSIIHAIKKIEAPVHVIINGEACSMAALIAINGDKRFAYEYSYIMFHSAKDYVHEDVAKIQDRAAYLGKLEERVEKMMKEQTKLKPRDIKKARVSELWLNAEEMLAKGIIHEII